MWQKWIDIYLKLFNRLVAILTIEQAWKTLAAETLQPKQFLKEFIYPFIALCVLLSFIGSLFFNNLPFVLDIVSAIFTGISLFCGFLLAKMICQKTTIYYYKMVLTDEQLDKIVGYSFSVVLLINALLSIFPSFFFLYFLLLYVVYMLWIAAGEMLGLSEDNRGKFLLINSLAIIGAPFIILKLLLALLPNVAI